MLTVSCKENWNQMPTVGNGRFCQKCQHSVVDFSNWDHAAVVTYKQAHPEACGRYRLEHVEPDLIPLADLLLPKRGILVAGLALGAIQVSAQVSEPQPTEQVAPVPDPATPTGIKAVPLVVSDKPDGVHGTCPRIVLEEPLPTAYKNPSRLYVSKRFPFVHKRRRYVMGF
ncbi:MAG: hypothetical protein KA941_10465 [Flavobacteriales bacterium]|nr:hypothetical protein [Flavobacteriales bacterium]